MRTRPIRAFFYQKTLLFGVRLGDWRWIGGATVIVFFTAVFCKLHIRGFHLALPLAIFTCLGGLSLFNWVRVKRKPLWLEHKFASFFRKHIKKCENVRPLYVGEKPRQSDWLIGSDGQGL